MHSYTRSTALGATFVLLAAPPATGAPGEDGYQGVIEEVVVTSRRRQESLEDVPLAVTAFSGDFLERIGAADITAIAQTTPNVTLEVSRGTNTTLTAFIRGVGQQDPVAGFEAGVGLYVDDVYLNRPQAAVLDLYDVERVEVLRGPQGTLYGRNTIGGAIKYVTRRLDDQPLLRVRGAVGSYSQFDGVLTASTPLSDTVRVGGAVARFTRDGFGDNLNLDGVDNYARDVTGGRLSAEWDASDRLFFRVSGDWVEDDSDPRQGHRLTVGNVTGAPVLDDVFDTRAGLDNPKQEVEAWGTAFTTEFLLSDRVTVKNILAWREDESRSPIDFDSLPEADLDVPVVYENEQFSEELQISYEGERVRGIAGFYYLDATAFNAFDVILGTTGDLLNLPGLNAFTLGDVDTETWSLFADVTVDLSEQWAVTVGGRYTDDERHSRVLRQTLIGGTSGYFGGSATPIATTSDFRGSETYTEFTPRASVSWYPVPDQHFYASYSEGFKGGSFDPRGLTSAAPDLDGDGDIDDADVFEFMVFEPETVESYELGWKASWLERRLTTSLAVFHADYTDIQIPGSVGFDSDGDGTQDSFIGITSNAGRADMTGVEFEGSAVAGEHVGLRWSVGYIDAEFDRFIDAFGNDVADERVFQNTPELTASLTGTFNWRLRLFAPGTASVITTVSYRDDTSQFETPNALLDQDSYTLWDLSLVWEDDSAHWRVGLHGHNLTDRRYKVAGYNFPTLGRDGSVTAFYGNPRTVTGAVEYVF